MLLKKTKLLIPFVIILIALFLRFYWLDTIPNGLYQDETALGYNAYSIEKIGKDEHGKVYPLYFKSFGDYKLPTYIYTTALSIKLFGPNEFAVRFPSAVFGTLSVLILFLLVKKLSKNTALASVSALLLAINPWHLHFSRAGFEVNLALFFTLLGTLLFITSINARARIGLFLAAATCFVLAEYSYNVTRLLSPLLFIGLIINFRSELRKISHLSKAFLVLSLLLVIFPFVTTFFINTGISATTGNLLLGPDNIAKNIEFRSYLSSWPDVLQKIFFNKWTFIFWQYLENIISSFSVKFLFIEGSQHGNHGIGNTGVFYLFQSLLILIGGVYAVRNKAKYLYVFFDWLAITILVLSLSKEVPHATRGFFLVIPLTVFSAYGLLVFENGIRRLKNIYLKISIGALASVIVFFSLLYYFTSYYLVFPVRYAEHWRSEDKKIAEYLKNNEESYSKIIIDKDANLIYTSLLFYQKYDPTKLISTQVREPDNIIGYHLIEGFGKYKYENIDWENFTEENALIVVGPGNTPPGIEPEIVFYYPTRSVAISANAQVGKVVVTDVAYKIYDSNKLLDSKR